jgi:chemotaxis methyl-accepting protein methylase
MTLKNNKGNIPFSRFFHNLIQNDSFLTEFNLICFTNLIILISRDTSNKVVIKKKLVLKILIYIFI